MEQKKHLSISASISLKELPHGEANVVAKELSYEDRKLAAEIMYIAREPGLIFFSLNLGLEWAFKYSAKDCEKYGAMANQKMLGIQNLPQWLKN